MKNQHESKLERRRLFSGRALSIAIVVTLTIASPAADAQWTITVDIAPDGASEPISPMIYGVNSNDGQEIDRTYPLVRWGGNHTSRYNWEADVANRSRDWYFINIPYEHPAPFLLPSDSTVDRLIERAFCRDSEVILTIPTLGWLPLDRNPRWAFSINKYGQQQGNAPDYVDAGNGFTLTTGEQITWNNPLDTSRPTTVDDTTEWLTHLNDTFGSPGDGGVRFYALDNEPMAWHETHRDVRPLPTTYDDVWGFTVAHASAIKAFDPDAQVMGPVSWGWCAYWSSGADQISDEGGCGWGPDKEAHDGVSFLEWYLENVCDYQDENGVRLIDYLDIHYYPAPANVALTSDESPETVARRLTSVRTLNDPDHWDDSWINLPINLIPMMQGMIDDACPGIGLAITEYNWGNDEGASSALAQAEVLAIFGAEGVDMAARWVVPKPNTAVEEAFLLYLDYDGSGSQLMGDSIPATSADPINLPAYAINGDYGRVYTLLFNKTDQVIHAWVTSTTTLVGDVEVYGFDFDTRLGARDSVEVVNGVNYTVVLPPYSATVAVASDGTPLPGDLGPGDAGCYPDDADMGDDLDSGDFDDVADLSDAPLDVFEEPDLEDDTEDVVPDQFEVDLQPDAESDGSIPDVLSDGPADADAAVETGGGSGDEGGCSTASAPGRSASVWLAALAFIFVARARRRD